MKRALTFGAIVVITAAAWTLTDIAVRNWARRKGMETD